MTTAMGPPPLQNPNHSPEPESNSQDEETSAFVKVSPMDPLPPQNPILSNLEAAQEESDDGSATGDGKKPVRVQAVKQSSVPYSIPEWSGPPCHRFQLEVVKDGSIVDQFDVCEKGAFLFGRADICDFVLEHPTISRFHTVLQFKGSGDAYIFDLGSTHGTFVNKNQVDKRVYVDLHVGDVIRFGSSTRLYIFQGPSELMPPEKDLKLIREAKLRQEMLDREASLLRARQEASMADGISWGMGEDAVEEEEDDVDEITWQTYKGQLTEKQQKTREKVLKRMEKIAHMKKEIAAIRAKDISQGGLTQGQQTQIARNEQRITQLLEELENLEETLNDSIRESIGARAGKITRGKKKGQTEDDEEFSSDEDEFYDRTRKKPSAQKDSEGQTVETAESLLEKRDSIMKEIEEKKELLSSEKKKMDSENVADPELGDSLDAYMTGLSSQLVRDRAVQLQQGLSVLQSELDRIVCLLKIADPTGEAVKKWELKLQEPKPKKSEKPMKPPAVEQKKNSIPTKPADASERKEETANVSVDSNDKPEAETMVSETAEGKTVVYTVTKPQWLGAVTDREVKEQTKHEIGTVSTDEPDEFVDYKDRKKILANAEAGKAAKPGSAIESAAPGLIIRKRKQEDEGEEIEKGDKSESKQADLVAQDAIALLLKHSSGHHEGEDEGINRSEEKQHEDRHSKKKKKEKKVLGPERPTFLDDSTEYDSWVPPEGQSGDGRTSLNDRYGY